MRIVLVAAQKSFDNHTRGETYWIEMSERLAHLIVDGYFTLLWDGGPDGSEGPDLRADSVRSS